MIQNKICFQLFIFIFPKHFKRFQIDFTTKFHYQLIQYVLQHYHIFSEIHPFLYHLSILQLQKICC